ncbi:hypothetical protein BWP39_10710 [Paraburkholderia acidicola]|uniref:ADP-heptose:LPS heptosyltransferase n=2 Tax=Paraburkholderia acidicola TaxID=1912599 RepID=A0A2A4EWB6_9BURK|nr:hypothetical protein BWP39_10710 [Paraburkholderia acidicola]
MRLASGQSVALLMSPRLGDSLLTMVVAHNLVRNGHRVAVFGDYIYSLKDWFASFEVHPTVRPDEARSLLGGFDVLLHAYPPDVIEGTRDWHPCVLVMDEWPRYRQVKTMVRIQMELCSLDLGLADVVPDNGLVPPPHLHARTHTRRVVIHPTANLPRKSWLPQRFIALALQLRNAGFEPEFVMAAHERKDWNVLDEHGLPRPAFATLADVAAWIYESGWFIGNDSGIAHLASNLGVPAVSLAVRRKIALRWRPGWAPSRAVLPLPVLPGKIAKDRLWKHFLPVSRVLKAFAELRAEAGDAATTAREADQTRGVQQRS